MDIKNLIKKLENEAYNYIVSNYDFIQDKILKRYYVYLYNGYERINLIYCADDIVYKCINYIIYTRDRYYLIVTDSKHYLIKNNELIENFIYRKLREN